MTSANETLRDESIRRQHDLTLYSNGVVRRIIGILNKVDPDLFAQLQQALESVNASNSTAERLDMLLQSVRQLNAQAYEAIGRELGSEMQSLTAHELTYQEDLFASLHVTLDTTGVTAEQVYAAAMARPFQGKLLREWAVSIGEDRMSRIRDAIRIGFVENQTNEQIVRRIRGTRANGYSDGLIEIDRRHAAAVVRTAVQHTAGFARDRVMEQNADLMKAVMWVSTLDARTSEICRIRDHLQYTVAGHRPIGHSIPWLAGPGRAHWCCRSTSAPVLRSWQELGIAIEGAPESVRASMDGAIPGDTTYAQWLKRQPAARQDEILGATRAELFRKGGLTMDQFYSTKGEWLSLSDLQSRYKDAFKRAGV